MITTKLPDTRWNRILDFLRQDPRSYVDKESQYRRFVEAVIWINRSGARWCVPMRVRLARSRGGFIIKI